VRRPLRLTAALAALAAGCAVLGSQPASAADTDVPGTMSTAAVNTSRFAVAVPPGVVPQAITGVLTMPEVVNNGLVTFRVNGRVALSVDSTLYAKVRIPVTAADVIADGTIGLSMTSTGPPIGGICRPAAGEASLRKIALTYTGREEAPTRLENFFPPAAARIDVLVPRDADVEVLEAGLAAVGALTARYGADTPVELNGVDQIPTDGTASQRIVVLTPGEPGEVTEQVTAGPSTGGVPTVTIAGTGSDLIEAAKELGTVGLSPDEVAAAQSGERTPQLERTLADFGVDALTLSGYGASTQRLRLLQDVFSTPVASLDLRLQGTTSALSPGERARIDVRVDGELVGSASLDGTGRLDLPVTIPADGLASVIELDVVLSATTADGTACAPAGVSPLEVQIDPARSTVTATALDPDEADFALLPQLLRGVLPVAIRPQADGSFEGALQAAKLISALQRVAAAPFDIQLVRPETFLADDRSGLLVGATAEDAKALGAPALLTSVRPATNASTLEVTSQEPYAVLQTVAQGDQVVLALGGWAPDDRPTPLALVRSVVEFAANPGWDSLRGDLILTDPSLPPTLAESAAPAVVEGTDESGDDDGFPWLWAVVAGAIALQVALFLFLLRRRERSLEAAAETEAERKGEGEPPSEEPVDVRTSTRAYLEDFEFREQNLAPPEDPPSATPPKAAPRTAPATKPETKPSRSTAPPSLTKRSRNQKKRR
jgi:hypothetical protein